MKRNWMLLAITLLCLSGCGRTSAYSDGKLFVSGRIDGDTVDISSKRDGKIVELTVREGDTVEVKIPSGMRTFEILSFTTMHDSQ